MALASGLDATEWLVLVVAGPGVVGVLSGPGWVPLP